MAVSSLARRRRPAGQRRRCERDHQRRRTRPHSLTPWAEVKGVAITYPGAAASHELPPARRLRRR